MENYLKKNFFFLKFLGFLGFLYAIIKNDRNFSFLDVLNIFILIINIILYNERIICECLLYITDKILELNYFLTSIVFIYRVIDFLDVLLTVGIKMYQIYYYNRDKYKI